MSHEAREAKTGVECFKGEEEEGVEERRRFCLVEWFMEKKKLSVAGVEGGGGVIRGGKQGLKLKRVSVFMVVALMVVAFLFQRLGISIHSATLPHRCCL